jgi:hypothetical protein
MLLLRKGKVKKILLKLWKRYISYFCRNISKIKKVMAKSHKSKTVKNEQITGVYIANPVYDVVFKYLLEDNAIAMLMVSSIIGENVVRLKTKPQEYTIAKAEAEGENPLTVYRLDFAATIKTDDGSHKLVAIEMQKASLPTDIMRFRRYLGDRYNDDSNRSNDGKALQIYTIYFLGKDLGICDTPVLSVFPVIRDVATQTVIEGQNEFIESLNHKCWVVQINCLKERRRNELEQLLSVFDQSNLTNDNHILNVREDDFPEKFRPVIRRLKAAASNKTIKIQMREEDGMARFMQGWLYSETNALKEAIAEQDNTIKEQISTIKDQVNMIKDKDQELEKRDKELDKKVQELDKKDRENEDLKKQIDQLRKMMGK